MKVLITGGWGFIGNNFTEQYSKKFDVIEDHWDLKNIVFDGNILHIKPHDLKATDTVIHLAAHISGEESWKIPHDYIINNTVNTLNLVKCAIDAKVKRIIFASSAAVYGNPLTPYGASKLAAEHILECYKDQIEVIILRIFNVYGKGQNEEYAGVITKFLDCIKEGKPIIVYGDGLSIRDYIHIDDVTRVLYKACKTKGRRWFEKPVQVGTGVGTSVVDLYKILDKLYETVDVKVKSGPQRKEIRKSIARIDRTLLPWKFITLGEGLKGLI